ncbi:MAG: LptF/LptG family permease [Gemmatimonadota bacterium]|nr:MAG: LptF/LptG family permease [Gemmatimonadota bacterium]
MARLGVRGRSDKGMIADILDRYLLREWLKIFLVTTIGFPLIVILFEITDKLDAYLREGLRPIEIAFAYVYSLPDKVFLVLPAAVLFATVFSLGTMMRHSELTAAKASGRSFYRTLVPILAAACLTAGAGIILGEFAPGATRKQLELLGDLEVRSRSLRQNFVYRADAGWVYTVRSLNVEEGQMFDAVLEREGSGDYPTVAIQAKNAFYDDSTQSWTLRDGWSRLMTETAGETAFRFDSLRLRYLTETPADLLAEPKKPEEMTYAELGRYIDALERSGGDGRKLRVVRELKFAVPITCIIIALFAAPLVIAAPRATGAFGIAISLATTMLFLLSVQLSQAVGAGGVLPPTYAAWTPNMLFGVTGLVLLSRART